MSKYENSIIYKLCCKDTDITDIYIGSTINFRNRKGTHKSSCLKNKSFKVYEFINENGKWENWDMILIEKVSCNDKLELRKKEREYIELLKPTLNMVNAYRTEEEKKEYTKIKCREYRGNWTEERKEQQKEKHKEYRKKNIEKCKQQGKNWNEKNKEYRSKIFKIWYDKNKEKLQEKYVCECGAEILKRNKSHHIKTKTHLYYIKNNRHPIKIKKTDEEKKKRYNELEKERLKVCYFCSVCKKDVKHRNKSRHEKGKLHQEYLKIQN